MPRRLLVLALLALAACGGEQKNDPSIYLMNRDPISVRGWIVDVANAKHADNLDMELARRQELFQSVSLWVESSQYSSGGIAPNGAFVILDVPPLKATIGFNAPGAENAQLTMTGVPGNADVFIPDIVLERGGAKVLDPKKILIRLPMKIDKAQPTGKTATIAGNVVPIIATPLGQLADRREYPNPGGFRPVAIVK
ncbi:MAG: hypothetical protein DMF56_02540 [Acidobacteria bacterium]|nr:MAG: hypothetical protein DMF56_02540 [Acidobacteriota bacterium]